MTNFLACPFLSMFNPTNLFKGFFAFVVFVALFYIVNKLIDLKSSKSAR